jgi:hypothetical protein
MLCIPIVARLSDARPKLERGVRAQVVRRAGANNGIRLVRSDY